MRLLQSEADIRTAFCIVYDFTTLRSARFRRYRECRQGSARTWV